MKPISPAIDPLSQRSAIDALESQRAAYRRFAQQAQAQSGSLGTGDVDQVAAFTAGATQDMAALHTGARAVGSIMDAARGGGKSTAELAELERRMDAMMREARDAETAIRNLTTQLEAWRDAFGKQLADLGITPGGSTTSTTSSDTPVDPAARGYGQRDAVRAPRLLDRKG
jgi:hypothetical protein